jgi:DNA-binding transcriptional LysR family regulator
LELRQIEGFFWVATLGSFSAAARRLLVTQSAISNRISALEKEIGEKLIERGHTELRLTARGLEFFQKSQKLLDLIRDIGAQRSSGLGLRGTVRFGVVNTIAHTWLPHLLLEIGRKLPAIDVDVTVGVSNAIEQLLDRGGIDVAIIVGPSTTPGIQASFLCRYPLAWIASNQFPISSGLISLNEIGRHRLMTYERGTIVHRLIVELFRTQGIWPVRLTGSNSVAAMVELALHKLVICAVPLPVVSAHIRSGQLRVLRTTPVLPDIEFYIACSAPPVNDLPAAIADIAKRCAREFTALDPAILEQGVDMEDRPKRQFSRRPRRPK